MNHSKKKNAGGFTLIELLVVIVILGILLSITAPAIFNTGARDSANVQSIISFQSKVLNAWRTVVVQNNMGIDPVDNPFFANANHTFLDVLAAGRVVVSAGNLEWYDTDGPGLMSEITIKSAPTATEAGVYLIGGDYTVDLANFDATTGELQMTFQNVESAVVQALHEDKEPTSAFDAATADTSGNVQYTAADANGEHTLTLLSFIK